MYHATECIFDYLAACGESEIHTLVGEVRIQCAHKNSMNAAVTAMLTLQLAGIIEHVIDCGEESGYFTLNDYGYWLVTECGTRERDYNAHKRATLG